MTTREARIWNPDTQQWEIVGMAPGPAGPKGDTGPAGAKGDPGKDGAAASVKVGKTETLAPGVQAYVKNVGTESAAVFDFGIPKGDPGGGGGGDTIPIGSIFPYVGSTAPFGWLMCDGTTVNSSTYPTLAALLAPFGGKTPDLRNRFPMGAGAQALGATGGNARISQVVAHQHSVTGSVTITGSVGSGGSDHAHSVSSATLSHTHNISTAANHTHAIADGVTGAAGNHEHGGVVTNVSTSDNSNTSGGGSLTRVSSVSVSKGSTATQVSHQHGSGGLGTGYGAFQPPNSGAAEGWGAPKTDTSGSHVHSLDSATGSLTNATAASSGEATVDVTNPFVALNYIIKAA